MTQNVCVIAHRGASHARPENTLPAFKHAIQLGADLLELDVRQTADRRAVIIHDPTVDRTTGGTGAVSGMKFRQIRALDAGKRFNEQYAGTKVPSLEEVLDLAKKADAGLDVQIYASETDRDSLTRQVVRALAERQFDERAFIAGEEDVIRLVRELDSSRPICNLTGQRDAKSLERCKALGSTIIQAFARYITPAYVERAHDMGLSVNVFYADHVSEMKRLIACGVDGILTNEPELLLRLLGRIPAAA